MVAIILGVELLLMNVIGICIRKSGTVTKEFSNGLTNMLMKFCIPCLIFYSISNAMAFSVEALANCAVVIALGFGAVVICLAIGQLAYKLSGKTGAGRVLRYGLTFSHFSFMGIPVMAALFGELGTFYYAFFLIPVRIFYYALNEPLMTPPELKGERKSIGAVLKAGLINPQILSVFLGLIFWVTGLRLPEPIEYCVKSLNTICSPLALLLCGMVLAEYDFKSILKPRFLKLPLLRTIAMPALFFLISRLLLLIGVDELLCKMLVTYTALPVSALLPLYALKYDPDPANRLDAVGACMISVLISTITIPLWSLVL